MRSILGVLIVTGLLGTAFGMRGVTVQAQSGSSILFEFDCAQVPWPCTSGRLTDRWQLWEADCDNSGCRWKWSESVESGVKMEVGGLEQWRLLFGKSDNPTGIDECTSELDEERSRITLEFQPRCSRFPNLCAGPRFWQIYQCLGCTGDANSSWEWYAQVDLDCVYYHLPVDGGQRYLLHWGTSRELEPTPRPSPTRTPTAVRTPTATKTRPPQTMRTATPTVLWTPIPLLSPSPTRTPYPRTSTPDSPSVYLPIAYSYPPPTATPRPIPSVPAEPLPTATPRERAPWRQEWRRRSADEVIDQFRRDGLPAEVVHRESIDDEGIHCDLVTVRTVSTEPDLADFGMWDCYNVRSRDAARMAISIEPKFDGTYHRNIVFFWSIGNFPPFEYLLSYLAECDVDPYCDPDDGSLMNAIR